MPQKWPRITKTRDFEFLKIIFLVVFLLFCVVESPLSPQSLTVKKLLKRKMKVDVCLLQCWRNNTNTERKHPGFCLSWRDRNPNRQQLRWQKKTTGQILGLGKNEKNPMKSQTPKNHLQRQFQETFGFWLDFLRLCPIFWICLHSQATFHLTTYPTLRGRVRGHWYWLHVKMEQLIDDSPTFVQTVWDWWENG